METTVTWKDKMRVAVGAYSAFLAIRNDPQFEGRFTTLNGESVLDKGKKATRKSIADVLVYMAGQYGKHLTIEEVEMGLLVGAKGANGKAALPASKKRRGVDFKKIGAEWAEDIGEHLHESKHELSGATIDEIIKRFDLHDSSKYGYRTVEQLTGVALSMHNWKRKRQMVNGKRFVRWYPPEEARDALNADEPAVVPEEKHSSGKRGVQPNAVMAQSIADSATKDYQGSTSFEIAQGFFEFGGEPMPETEDDLEHRVKLLIGATMKYLGWTSKIRKKDGVSARRWYAPDDWIFTDDDMVWTPEELRRANRRPASDEDVPEDASLADGLPRLEEAAVPEREWVKRIDTNTGGVEVFEAEVVMKKTGVYLMDDNGIERMLEWNVDDSIWRYEVDGSNFVAALSEE